MMDQRNEKPKKFYRNITDIVKETFGRGGAQNKCKEESVEEIGTRNRSQGIFRTFKKKLKQNKLCKSKKVTAVETAAPTTFQKGGSERPAVEDYPLPPDPPPRSPRAVITDGLDDNENQYLESSELNPINHNADYICSPSKSDDSNHSLGREHINLAKYGWFWGPISKREAEVKLSDKPDGSFLIRDSSSERYVFTLSFRSYGQTMHSHIEYSRGVYSMGEQSKSNVADLIEAAIVLSKSAVFSYSRSRNPADPAFPVRLTAPVSRFTDVRSLQYLCRFVIRQYINVNNIQKLPIPTTLKGYLQQGQY